ncbi:MAG: Kelch repeat-containing protein [Solirubrobacterales bacterium]
MRAVRREVTVGIAVAALLAGSVAGCGSSGSGSGKGDGSGSTAVAQGAPPPRPKRLLVKASPHHLPAPVSGEAVVPQGKDLLVIGGLDESDVSIAAVTKLDPSTGATTPAGELSEPLHDTAAAAAPSGVLVFGGGSATTTAEVQRLVPGGTGEAVGRLPVPRSDLSAVTVGSATYVLAGYDGEGTVGDILRTRDGSKLETVAKLPDAVRYAAVAALGPIIYAIGGEETDGADSTAIQAFDTRSGRASAIGHLAAPLAHASAVVLGGRIYVVGGRLNGSTTDQILRFDPATGTSLRAGRLPEPVQNAAAAVVGGTGYLIGGLTPEEKSLASIVTLRLVRQPPP